MNEDEKPRIPAATAAAMIQNRLLAQDLMTMHLFHLECMAALLAKLHESGLVDTPQLVAEVALRLRSQTDFPRAAEDLDLLAGRLGDLLHPSEPG